MSPAEVSPAPAPSLAAQARTAALTVLVLLAIVGALSMLQGHAVISIHRDNPTVVQQDQAPAKKGGSGKA